MDDIAYWVAFTRVPGIGRVRLSQLERHFGELGRAWTANAEELRKAGLDSKTVSSLEQARAKVSPDSELELMRRYQVRAVACRDPEYPTRLKEIHDHPPVLFVRGDLLGNDECCLGVVGTRKATAYGKQVAADIVAGLARAGVTVVSGLARGIDSVAHRVALDSGGRTIAVFAGGLDTVYPPENAEMARRIVDQGALVSEHPVGVRPKADNFSIRNRIISGLSLGVLVVEAGDASGALITAMQANEQDREVFAVPGSVLSPMSKGTNRLIQQGAKLVTDHTDILGELNLTMVAEQLEMKATFVADEAESSLLTYIADEPLHIDEICRRSGLPASAVTGTLAVLELKGMVKQMGGMNFVMAKR